MFAGPDSPEQRAWLGSLLARAAKGSPAKSPAKRISRYFLSQQPLTDTEAAELLTLVEDERATELAERERELADSVAEQLRAYLSGPVAPAADEMVDAWTLSDEAYCWLDAALLDAIDADDERAAELHAHIIHDEDAWGIDDATWVEDFARRHIAAGRLPAHQLRSAQEVLGTAGAIIRGDVAPAPKRSASAAGKEPAYKSPSAPPSSSMFIGRHSAASHLSASADLDFVVDARVAQRFNAYAAAAAPNEIGGLLRIVRDGRSFRAVELKVFPQVVSSAHFELDGPSVAAFNMELVRTGRREQVREWKSLVHSHPGFAPVPSQPDRENLNRLAGSSFAFSVIVATSPSGRSVDRNEWVVHYQQADPFTVILDGLRVRGDGGSLTGLELLDDEELAGIEADVRTMCRRTVRDGLLKNLRDGVTAPAAPVRSPRSEQEAPRARGQEQLPPGWTVESLRPLPAPAEPAAKLPSPVLAAPGPHQPQLAPAPSSSLPLPGPDRPARPVAVDDDRSVRAVEPFKSPQERMTVLQALQDCNRRLPSHTKRARDELTRRLYAGEQLPWCDIGMVVRVLVRAAEVSAGTDAGADRYLKAIGKLRRYAEDGAAPAPDRGSDPVLANGLPKAKRFPMLRALSLAHDSMHDVWRLRALATLADVACGAPLYRSQVALIRGMLASAMSDLQTYVARPQRQLLDEVTRIDADLLAPTAVDALHHPRALPFQRDAVQDWWTPVELSSEASDAARAAVRSSDIRSTGLGQHIKDGTDVGPQHHQELIQLLLRYRAQLLADRDAHASELTAVKDAVSGVSRAQGRGCRVHLAPVAAAGSAA